VHLAGRGIAELGARNPAQLEASGPPMRLANMRRQGVHHLIAYCLNDSCKHQALIDVSSYPGDTSVPWFRRKVKCAKCGARGNRIDARPNWKKAPGTVADLSGRPIMPGDDD
jgi:transposase